MHEDSKTPVERMAVEIMERHFMDSPAGQPFSAEYEQLEKDMETIKRRYHTLWAQAEAPFVEYMRAYVSK